MKMKLLAAALLLGSSSFAIAADAVVYEPVAFEEIPVGFSWTGAYIGAQVGYGWGRSGDTYVGFDETVKIDNDGWLGGVQAGYNYQHYNWVFGIEGEFSWSNSDGQNDIFSPSGDDVSDLFVDMNWLASVSARAGYAVERTLFYAKGGIGFTDIWLGDTYLNSESPHIEWDGSKTLTGWTIGTGVEHALTDHWTIKAEYQYYRFNAEIPMYKPGIATDERTFDDYLDIHTLKTAISYKF